MKANNFYFLPGGSVEHQEELHDAIYREFQEEMGLEKSAVKIKKLMAICEVMFGTEHSVDPLFEVELKDGADINSIEDHIAFEWVDLSKLDDIDFRPKAVSDWIVSGCKENHIVHNDLKS